MRGENEGWVGKGREYDIEVNVKKRQVMEEKTTSVKFSQYLEENRHRVRGYEGGYEARKELATFNWNMYFLIIVKWRIGGK